LKKQHTHMWLFYLIRRIYMAIQDKYPAISD